MAEHLDCNALYATLVECAAARAEFIDWEAGCYDYRSVVDDINAWCAVFDAAGLPTATKILIQSSNEKIGICAFMAALLDGHVPVMLAPDTPQLRRQAIADLIKPGLVVLDEQARTANAWRDAQPIVAVTGSGRRSLRLLGSLRRIGTASDRPDDLDSNFGSRQPRCDVRPNDLAYILFTSGTTSAPKGVMVTHRNLFAQLETISRVFSYGKSSAIFNGLFLAHADGLIQGPLLTAINGSRLIRPPAFSLHTLERHLNLIREKRATHFVTVPTIYRFIDRYAQRDDYFEFPEFTALVSVAAKLDNPLWQRLEDRFGRPVYNMYGLTETVTSALYAGPGLGPIGTIGRPIDVDIRLVNCADRRRARRDLAARRVRLARLFRQRGRHCRKVRRPLAENRGHRHPLR